MPDWEAFCGPHTKVRRRRVAGSNVKETDGRRFDVTQQQHVSATPVFLPVWRSPRFKPPVEEKPGRISFCNSGLDAPGPGDCCRAEAPRNRAKCRLFGFSQTTDRSCRRTPQQHARVVRGCFIHGNVEGFQSTLRRLDHADQSFIHKEGRHRRGTDGRRQRGNLKLSGWSLPNPDGGLIRLHRKVRAVSESVASSADMLARRHVTKALTCAGN